KILKKKHIILNLEHLNNIPNEWLTIIEESLGLVPVKAKKEDISEVSQDTPRPFRRRISLKSNKIIIEDELLDEKLNNENEEGVEVYSPLEIKETEYQKLSGPKLAGDRIDLSKFDKPISKEN